MHALKKRNSINNITSEAVFCLSIIFLTLVTYFGYETSMQQKKTDYPLSDILIVCTSLYTAPSVTKSLPVTNIPKQL